MTTAASRCLYYKVKSLQKQRENSSNKASAHKTQTLREKREKFTVKLKIIGEVDESTIYSGRYVTKKVLEIVLFRVRVCYYSPSLDGSE